MRGTGGAKYKRLMVNKSCHTHKGLRGLERKSRDHENVVFLLVVFLNWMLPRKDERKNLGM